MPHFTAFITSYVWIQLLEQIKLMDINKIVKVVSDGIYTTETHFWINKVFRNKRINERSIKYLEIWEDDSFINVKPSFDKKILDKLPIWDKSEYS